MKSAYRHLLLCFWVSAVGCGGDSPSDSPFATRVDTAGGASNGAGANNTGNGSATGVATNAASGGVGAGGTGAAEQATNTGSGVELGAGGATGSGLGDATGGGAGINGDMGVGANASSGASGDAAVGGSNGEGNGEGAIGGPVLGACTGKPGALRGKSNQSLDVGGKRRSFVYYAPSTLDPTAPVPLVFVPHGSTMSGQQMFEITEYSKLADQEGFVVIFPDGVDGPGSIAPWNVGQGTCGLGALVAGNGNDQAFVDAMIDFAKADQCIDEPHIFMAGFSMGGYFSHETSCLNDKIAAVGPHSGGTHDLSGCPGKPKPTIIMHFDTDSLIDYQCAQSGRDQVLKRNGCSAAGPEVVEVQSGKCEYYRCPEDAQVALCTFKVPSANDDGLPFGHGWAGGSKQGSNPLAAITNTASATELSWQFFTKYAW